MYKSDNSFEDKKGLKVFHFQPLIKREVVCLSCVFCQLIILFSL